MTADRKTILLVDDSDIFLTFEQMMLRKTGARILTALDGVQAVEAAQREKPDLILMDLNMPNMNGLEAAEKILGDPSLSSIPIIMVTARSEGENVKRAMELGCTSYVFKPIDVPELLEKVENALGEARPES